ncbi:MAG TPA: GNAT family N-acetyltransferase [Dinghuibacter sp.]|uniref:GNAT family N-acetyltransferase n=1 Tax=Dinghuibacter sp. TaxID=2024697 RepID=UPI002C842670|nr:GNAT family N-acetyltransferase [Dinghuibacter sp.]HTJ12320.1 GNAT family N-acetyltransferase [Dinghuibacter sp.]
MIIAPIAASPSTIDALADLLVETVAAGGSVSFMHPLSVADATAFWRASLAEADKGTRVVLGAWDGPSLIGTLTLLLDCPPNQPHRAELAKMMTRVAFRGRGVATQLLLEAERIALDRGRTVINLDTAEDEGAAGFYEKMGYIRAGVIPDYALKPHGGLTGTIIFWKKLSMFIM